MSAIRKLAKHPGVKRVADAVDRHKLFAALALFISAAIVLTGISLSMYYGTGFYRYDLSRPAYAKERTELAKPESQRVYDTTGPITKTSIEDFLKEYDGRIKNLDAYGDFRDASLSDEDLQIAPPAN